MYSQAVDSTTKNAYKTECLTLRAIGTASIVRQPLEKKTSITASTDKEWCVLLILTISQWSVHLALKKQNNTLMCALLSARSSPSATLVPIILTLSSICLEREILITCWPGIQPMWSVCSLMILPLQRPKIQGIRQMMCVWRRSIRLLDLVTVVWIYSDFSTNDKTMEVHR